MFCLDYGHCSAYIYSNLQREYQSYVELYQQEQTIFNNGNCLHSEHIYMLLYMKAMLYELSISFLDELTFNCLY